MGELDIKINAELVLLAEFYGKRGNTAKARELLRVVERRRRRLEIINQETAESPITLTMPSVAA